MILSARQVDVHRLFRDIKVQIVGGPVDSLHWRMMAPARKPRIAIEYCTQCHWLLRAAWMAQELLTTFQDEVGEVALIPGTGGVFRIQVGTETIWSRAEKRRFPEMKELKQLVRDRVAPGRDLGHSDRKQP